MSDELDREAAPDGDDGHLDSLVDFSPKEPTALHRHVSLNNLEHPICETVAKDKCICGAIKSSKPMAKGLGLTDNKTNA